MSSTSLFNYPHNFSFESGKTLHRLELAYTVCGKLNKNKDNVVWICHALTANSVPSEWWHGLVGENCFFEPEKYFIVCCNLLGSCYGSSGPLSLDEHDNKYGKNFPVPTIRDNVKAQKLLFDELEINKIHIVLGGSMGGQQTLEWAIQYGEYIEHAAVIACGAYQSAWAKALNATQRMAIEADATWKQDDEQAGMEGMKTARAMALLSYRSYEIYQQTQSDNNNTKLENYKAASYQRYQGEKLAKRFVPSSYYILTQTMDSHDISRGRDTLKKVLKKIQCKTLVVGISSDILFPVSEQKFLARNISDAVYKEIHSDYGHDGFLVEFKKLGAILKDFTGR